MSAFNRYMEAKLIMLKNYGDMKNWPTNLFLKVDALHAEAMKEAFEESMKDDIKKSMKEAMENSIKDDMEKSIEDAYKK